MVSHAATRDRYRGKMASGYEAKRVKQERWHAENTIVAEWVEQMPVGASVLDVPVGTGRFLPLYRQRSLKVIGVDSSQAMLDEAYSYGSWVRQWMSLRIGDAAKLEFKNKMFDLVVCVRFLDLLPRDDMERVLSEITRVSRHRVILTIRLGAQYVAKSNTATHEATSFYREVKRLGFEVKENRSIFKQGWYVMLLERKT